MNHNRSIIDKVKKHGLHVSVSIIRWAFFILIAFIVLYPLITQFIGMFMTTEDVHDMSVHYIPRHFTFDNIVAAWKKLNMETTLPYTIIITASIAFLQMAFSTLTGYGLARFKFRLNAPLTIMALIGLVLPQEVLLIPLYNIFRSFRLFGLVEAFGWGNGLSYISFVNTPIPLIVLSVFCVAFRCGLFIMIMRQYFRTLPKEMEEAAEIDGSSQIGTFFRIMLPGAMTMMVTIFLFSFVWLWLDTDFSSVFMGQTDLLVTKVINMNKVTYGSEVNQVFQNLMAYAGIIFLVFPLIILYTFTQRFFVESVERSGLVG